MTVWKKKNIGITPLLIIAALFSITFLLKYSFFLYLEALGIVFGIAFSPFIYNGFRKQHIEYQLFGKGFTLKGERAVREATYLTLFILFLLLIPIHLYFIGLIK